MWQTKFHTHKKQKYHEDTGDLKVKLRSGCLTYATSRTSSHLLGCDTVQSGRSTLTLGRSLLHLQGRRICQESYIWCRPSLHCRHWTFTRLPIFEFFPKMGMAKAYHIIGEKAIPRPSYFRPLLLALIRGIIFAVLFFAFSCSIPACICEDWKLNGETG